MNSIIAIASLTLFLLASPLFAAETKKVCVDKITNDGKPVLDKQGKPVQDCKEIKVHKKLEGTAVPQPEPKK